MSTSKTWPGGGTGATATSYSIPASGELNWASLTNFLTALADGAQSTTFQKFAVRKATASPVTVAVTDCIVVCQLTVAGTVAVTLPAGANKQVLFIVDGTGDAGTNTITITRAGADTIAGGTTTTLTHNREAIILVYNSSDTDWKIAGRMGAPGAAGSIVNADVSASAAIALSKLATVSASKALVSDSGGLIVAATTTSTQIGYLSSAGGTTGTTTTNLVFSTSPTLTTPSLGVATCTSLNGLTVTSSTGTLTLVNGSSLITAGAYAVTLTATNTTGLTLPTTGTLATLAGTEALTNKTLTSPFVNEAVALSSTATKLNYLTSAGGTTGTTSTNIVFSTSPTLVTPVLGVAAATTINKVTLTTPATGSTLTITDGKTLACSNTLTFTGTDTSSVAFGTGGTVVYTANKLSVHAATSSAELAGVISDETGSDALVFQTSPALTTPTIAGATISGTVTLTSTPVLSGALAHTSNTSGDLMFHKTYSTNATGTSLRMQKGRGTLASPAVVAASDILGQIAFDGYSGAAAAFVVAASITAGVDGTPDSAADPTDMPGYLAFSTTADGAGVVSERARIPSTGELLVGVTSRTANGGILQVSNGITFPATQSACSDVNTLDDYEEGTYTPTLTASTSTGTMTASMTGYYVKIGNLVYVRARAYNMTKGSGSGTIRITLPFTASSTIETQALSVTDFYTATTTGSGSAWVNAIITSGAPTYAIFETYHADNTGDDAVTVAMVAAGFTGGFSGCYSL